MSIGNRKYFFEHFSQNFGFFAFFRAKSGLFGAHSAPKSACETWKPSIGQASEDGGQFRR
jgi:hypothetical protein